TRTTTSVAENFIPRPPIAPPKESVLSSTAAPGSFEVPETCHTAVSAVADSAAGGSPRLALLDGDVGGVLNPDLFEYPLDGLAVEPLRDRDEVDLVSVDVT